MEYREIIRENIRKLVLRKDKASTQKEKDRCDFFIGQLLADLRDWEGRGTWLIEPMDKAWERYRGYVRGLDIWDIIKRMLDDDWDFP